MHQRFGETCCLLLQGWKVRHVGVKGENHGSRTWPPSLFRLQPVFHPGDGPAGSSTRSHGVKTGITLHLTEYTNKWLTLSVLHKPYTWTLREFELETPTEESRRTEEDITVLSPAKWCYWRYMTTETASLKTLKSIKTAKEVSAIIRVYETRGTARYERSIVLSRSDRYGRDNRVELS